MDYKELTRISGVMNGWSVETGPNIATTHRPEQSIDKSEQENILKEIGWGFGALINILDTQPDHLRYIVIDKTFKMARGGDNQQGVLYATLGQDERGLLTTDLHFAAEGKDGSCAEPTKIFSEPLPRIPNGTEIVAARDTLAMLIGAASNPNLNENISARTRETFSSSAIYHHAQGAEINKQGIKDRVLV